MKAEEQGKNEPRLDKSSVSDAVKIFILNEFLPDEEGEFLTHTTPLISSGIIDSIGLVRLITYLEDSFGISISTVEVSLANFDDLKGILGIVERKLM